MLVSAKDTDLSPWITEDDQKHLFLPSSLHIHVLTSYSRHVSVVLRQLLLLLWGMRGADPQQPRENSTVSKGLVEQGLSPIHPVGAVPVCME